MDFIERLTGLSPDGGNGFTEMAFVIAASAVLTAIAVYRSLRSSRKAQKP